MCPHGRPKTPQLTPRSTQTATLDVCRERGSLPSPPLMRPVLLLPFVLPLRERSREASEGPSVPGRAASLCSCSFANYALTHALFGERESTEGNLRGAAPSRQQALSAGASRRGAAVLARWQSGSARPGSCARGAAWPPAQGEEGGEKKKTKSSTEQNQRHLPRFAEAPGAAELPRCNVSAGLHARPGGARCSPLGSALPLAPPFPSPFSL